MVNMITAYEAEQLTANSSEELSKHLIPMCEGAIIATAKLGGRSIDILDLVDEPTRKALISNHNVSNKETSILSKITKHFRTAGFDTFIHVITGAQPYPFATIDWNKKLNDYTNL
jgi:hypothetical protein